MSKRALVVGLGIGGMSSAIGLHRAGYDVVIAERSPERRTGGYFVGMFPEGKTAAIDLGVLERIHLRTITGSDTWEMTAAGKRTRSVGFLDQPGSPEGVLRGDIEAGLWDALPEGVTVRYATSPVEISDAADGARVRLHDSSTGEETQETYDLVVGADGLRSTVRRLVFGEHRRFLRPLNAMICAFQLPSQVPGFTDHESVVVAEPGRSLWVFPLSDHTPTALLTYRTRKTDAQFQRAPIESLRRAYQGMNSAAVDHVLAALESVGDDFLFDSVHQVHMKSWHKGHVVLLGDAAWCLTLYSGMGATSAMRGGALLGDVLRRHPDDLAAALEEWEATLRPFITKHRRAAHFKAQVFVPAGRLLHFLRGRLLARGAKALLSGRRRQNPVAGEAEHTVDA